MWTEPFAVLPSSRERLMPHDSMPAGSTAATLPAFKAIHSLGALASPKRTLMAWTRRRLKIQAGCR